MKLPSWPNPKGFRDINLGLSRVYDLLDRLENPHEKIPPTIHIAGTNGKGSTLSFLKNIFQEAGYSIHSYTSPHLISFSERIVLNGKNIEDDFLNECLAICKNASESSPKIEITYFEGITVAAFLAFSKIKADLLLLETGMGGRLDATNVIKQNLLSIITPISFDHTEFLGNSLEKIAYEKAGIIKNNCPTIIAKQSRNALKIIKEVAKVKCAKTYQAKVKINKNNFYYSCKDLKIDQIEFPLPSLIGDHQIENAKNAITAALSQKKLLVTTDNIKSAITKTNWQARLQKINYGKFYKILPNNFELILDGSHNVQGAETVYKFLKSQKNKKIFVIFSMLKDKNCIGFLDKIKNQIDHLIAVTIANESKSLLDYEILAIAKKLKINSSTAIDFEDAFAKIIAEKNNNECLILICGSLYLAGNFLEQNEEK